MNNRDLLKEAIADAKAVKETAIANAKAALEEAFTPRLRAMMSEKIDSLEEEDVEEAYDKVDEMKSKEMEEGYDEKMEEGYDVDEAENMDEEMDLDEILAELDEELNETKDVEEGKDEIKEEEMEMDSEEEMEMDSDDEEVDLEEMSEEDLKKFIEDVIEDMVKAGELEAGEDFEDDVDVDVDAEGEIEIEDDNETAVDEGEKEEIDEMDAVSWNEKNSPTRTGDFRDPKKVGQSTAAYAVNEEEMNEMRNEINELKNELNEINLLNSKLLYVNKIFRSKNLTESQKSKVVNAFDKATSVNEVKLVFETISENLTSKKVVVKENLGRASKPAGVAPKKPIVEVDSQVERWQKLAGLR